MSTPSQSNGKLCRRLLPALILLASTLFAFSDTAQAAQTAPRILGQIDESRLTRLPGNVPALAQARYDQGEASPSTELTHMRLVLSRGPEQKAAVEKYMLELQDKSSPNYHKWLTPEQIAQLYGPADSDIAALVAWLESHGFKLERVSAAHTSIAFSGTVSQTEEAFHTPIHSFSVNGNQFYSNTVDPSIPSALLSIVVGVARLNTIRPLANYTKGSLGTFDSDSSRLMPANVQQEKLIHPNLTEGSAGAYTLYVVPSDAATIYDTPNTTFNANYTSGTSYTGAGVTIGIGGDSAILASTIVSYRTKFLGDSTSVPTITNVDGVGENGDSDEAYIDTELSGGLAPGAAIHYYASNDLISGIVQALDDNTVDIFSLSFGNCEANLGDSNNSTLNGMWNQAFMQGIAVTVSTGDSGSAGCDANQDSSGNNIPDASGGLGVNGFATTPYNIAVGGTDFYPLNDSFTTYASTSSTSSTHYRSANKYIPESTWNDSTVADGAISANSPFTGTNANIVGAGGGKSSCITSNAISGACVSGYPKPSWQRGTGVPADGVRDIPDISLMAGNGADSSAWLVCTDDTGTVSGVTVTANCTTQSNNNFYFFGFGGTSTAAPAFAGMLALVQQKTNGRLGQASKDLYDLFNGTHSASIFHDTTVGNNSVPCLSGSPNCVQNTAGFYYESGYDTNVGYDLATGIGSVDVAQLINFWGSAIGSATSTVGVVPSASTITTAQALTVVVTVTGSGTNGTPTGTVSLSGGGYTSSSQALVAGTYTFAIPAGSLSVGADTLTVSYSGDASYASKTGTATVTVTLPPAPIAALSATSLAFGSVNVGSTPTNSVTLKNTGNANLTGITISVVAVTGTAFTQTNTCSATLAAGDSCTITATFTPTAPGAVESRIQIVDNAVGSPQLVDLTGTGVVPAPIVTLTPTTLTFASTLVGSSATPQVVTLKNTGAASLTVTGVSITGTNATSFSQTNNCTTVAVSGTCSITVNFGPAAGGTLTAAVSIADNATGSPQTLALTGTGAVPTPVIGLSPSSLTFASTTVGSSAATQSITVSNTGTAPLVVTSVSVTGTNASSFTQTNTCTTVAISGTCTVVVTFTPTIFGTLTGSISIADNAAGSPQTVGLTGTAAEAGAFTLAGTTVTVSPGSSGTSTITATGAGGYFGTITLSCVLATSPSGATDLPTCTPGSAITIASGSTTGTGTIAINTTAASNAVKLAKQEKNSSTGRLAGIGGVVLAGILLIGIPARRKYWRSMLALLVFIAGLGVLSGCGGGGGGNKNPGTTAGNYTFTVTGTDAAAVKQTTTITVTVN